VEGGNRTQSIRADRLAANRANSTCCSTLCSALAYCRVGPDCVEQALRLAITSRLPDETIAFTCHSHLLSAARSILALRSGRGSFGAGISATCGSEHGTARPAAHSARPAISAAHRTARRASIASGDEIPGCVCGGWLLDVHDGGRNLRQSYLRQKRAADACGRSWLRRGQSRLR